MRHVLCIALVSVGVACSKTTGPGTPVAGNSGETSSTAGSTGAAGSGGAAGHAGSGGTSEASATTGANGVAGTAGTSAQLDAAASGTGGTSSATGGASATSGIPSTGGTTTGGAVASGGTPSTGGSIATGGTATGGISATGGTIATGGLPSTGGNQTTGGAVSTGGIAASDAAASDVGSTGDAASFSYTFTGDKLDGGTLPTGFQAVAGGSAYVWSLVMDGSNEVLQGVGTATPTYVETDIVSWTDQTIEVKVRFMSAQDTNAVRICGRFAPANPFPTGYCLYVSTAGGDAGSTGGSMTIDKRADSVATLGASVTGLNIMVGTWHTYRLAISGQGPVELNAYLDGASTPTISRTDSNIGSTTPPYLTVGGAALGVVNVTADFDDLIVTTP